MNPDVADERAEPEPEPKPEPEPVHYIGHGGFGSYGHSGFGHHDGGFGPPAPRGKIRPPSVRA